MGDNLLKIQPPFSSLLARCPVSEHAHAAPKCMCAAIGTPAELEGA